MAKKNANDTAAAHAPRRAAARKAASVTPVEPLDSAADMGGVSAAASYQPASSQPSYEEIAQEAYQRYLSRGGGDGRDFDDWIEAERALTRRAEQR